MEILTPRGLEEALKLRSKYPEAVLWAGGTDLMVHIKEKRLKEPPLGIYLGKVPLNHITDSDNMLHIGTGCTHAQISASPVIQTKAGALAMACKAIGSPQIRQMGTLGGNLGTASPAGDTLPALVSLGASLILQSLQGKREMSVEKFLLGPGQTALSPFEIITEVKIPCQRPNESSFFRKLGARNALAISLASISGRVTWHEDGLGFSAVSLAFGSVSPTVLSVREAAEILSVPIIDNAVLEQAAKKVKEACKPITDIRASANYRREIAGNLLLEQIISLLESKRGGCDA